MLLAGGEDIGPGRPAVLRAGERASVHKHLGPGAGAVEACEVEGAAVPVSLGWAESTRRSTDLTIVCPQGAILLTGTASAVVSAVQSPWIMAPVGMVLLGILLFFPRFTLAWLRLRL